MGGSIQIPFEVGSKAWLARVNQDEEWVPCYACAGTLKHSVTLGCGETHVVACESCGADRRFDYDYDSSSHWNVRPGFVKRYSIRPTVEEVTLTDVEVRGSEVNYTSNAPGGGRYIHRCEGLFATEAEARAHAESVVAPAAQNAKDELFLNNTLHGRVTERAKKAARNAAFWKRQRAEAVEQLAQIDRRLERIMLAAREGGAK